ncbi:hypothetical protein EST38_g3126 [Candolleomyces aberdarensis]|uniref:Protein YOP1 n=1 Tax=Candolleomyces aberdarensis TaxID=2316362 RepID=A0A4Q2DUB8_9AGAR|nr:hypothetical protein EST38_g3126 [Candolleomyces aberdarensis]
MLFHLTSRIVGATSAFMYPAYASYKTLSQRPASEEDLERWLMYWSVLGCVVAVEYLAEWLVSWVPFYFTLKTLFLLYLSLPQTKGSTYVYLAHLQPFFSTHESQIDATLASFKAKVKAFVQERLRLLWEQVAIAIGQQQTQQQQQAATSPAEDPNGASGPAQLLGSLWTSYGPSILASGTALLRQSATAAASRIPTGPGATMGTAAAINRPHLATSGGGRSASDSMTQSVLDRKRQLEAELAALNAQVPGDGDSLLRERTTFGTGRFEEIKVPSDVEGYDVEDDEDGVGHSAGKRGVAAGGGWFDTPSLLRHQGGLFLDDDQMDPDDIETQKALDARIKQLQSELTDLKRRRNALSPISRLPSEISYKILMLNRQEDLDSKEKKIVPQYILLCHVSHFWRTIMLGCPEFWVDIRLMWSASWRGCQMLIFMAHHARSQKISVTYTRDRPQDHEHGPDIPLTIDSDLVRTLQQESSKIKSLSLVLGKFDRNLDGGLEAEVANIFSEGEFSNLENFILEITPKVLELPPALELDKVFKNRPPQLQRLGVVGWRLFLESSRQPLQGMTHLILEGDLVGSLFELLSLSPGLKTLHLMALRFTQPSNFTYPPNAPGQVCLPHLESLTLNLHSYPLLDVLKGIQIPPNLAHFQVQLGHVFSHRMREFFDAWKLAQKGVIEPEHVLIDKPAGWSVILSRLIFAWKTTESPDQFTPDVTKRTPPSVVLTYNSDPRLRLGSPMHMNDNMHPFVEPQDYQHKWSFGKVKVVELLGPLEGDEDWARRKIYRLGNHFWTTIANAPYLQLLYLNSRLEDEFKEMIIKLGQGVFPALQYLIFSFVRCETTLRRISFDEFAASFVEYFKPNRATPLALLGFRHCPERSSQDTLDALKEVAVRVVCRETQEWP